MRRYPHQLSGGMQQRVVIAMALAKDPALLILDEPTTGLDATVEAEVLDLVAALRDELGTTVLFISHNLGVISKMCDRVGVLYAGRLVEEGPADDLLRDPRHPYTVGLLRCIPRGGVRKDDGRLDTIPGVPPAARRRPPGCVFADRCALADEICRTARAAVDRRGPGHARCFYHDRRTRPPAHGAAQTPPRSTGRRPLVRSTHLGKTFSSTRRRARARGVTPRSGPGETLGLVGESGSGKTTLRPPAARARCSPTCRRTCRARRAVARCAGSAEALARRAARAPDRLPEPDSALNRAPSGAAHPRPCAEQALAGVAAPRPSAAARARGRRALPSGSLDAAAGAALRRPEAARRDRARLRRRPDARRLRRADLGARRLGAGRDPQPARRPAGASRTSRYLFISHDLGVVRYLADRIAVLYLGRLMEIGAGRRVFAGPHHPYTEALLSAVPTLDGGGRTRIRLEGDDPERRRAAVRLRLPHPLPAQARRDLRARGAAARRGRGRPH